MSRAAWEAQALARHLGFRSVRELGERRIAERRAAEREANQQRAELRL